MSDAVPTDPPPRAARGPEPARAGDEIVFGPLPVGALGRRSAGWWGAMTLILTEAVLFGYLLFSYAFLALHPGGGWEAVEPPSFRLSGPNTALLLASSGVVHLGGRALRRGRPRRAAGWLALGAAMGAAFLGVQGLEWAEKPFGLDTHAYGSLYFVITGFHGAHVLAGLLMLIPAALWCLLGRVDGRRDAPVAVATAYWHFVDAVWVAVFATLYVSPHLLAGGGP